MRHLRNILIAGLFCVVCVACSSDGATAPAKEGAPQEFSLPKSSVVQKKHVIRTGETLSLIAQMYHMSLARLRELNPQLKGDHIREGDVLTVEMK